jgi:hypothetical protein
VTKTAPRRRSPAHPLTRSPAHPLTRSPAHPLTRSPAHPLTRSPTAPTAQQAPPPRTTHQNNNSIARTKVAGCNACDPIVPAVSPRTKKPTHTCTACGAATGSNAYTGVYDPATKRCVCSEGFGQDINVASLVAASLNPATGTTQERRKIAKQAAAYKGIFAAGVAGGVCVPCPAKPDLLGQTYASPGGLLPAATCAPVVVPPVTP